MQQNLEIKLRCPDLDLARRRVLENGAIEHETLEQVDTYFVVQHGRLKLREISGRSAQLIWYQRPDQAGARISDFQLLSIREPDALKTMLTASLGLRGEVHKHRRVLLWKNVRIHLDDVQRLGTFIELEAVISTELDRDESAARLTHLRTILQVAEEECIGESYSDLLGI